MRLWPVWYSAESGRMSFVRSNLERAAAGAFAEAGAVSFTLMSNKQMGYLQAGLGHRWSGDLTSYGFQPDCLPMPRINYRPAVVEMFGVRSLKRYDESKSRKKDAGLMNPDIRFVSIEGRLTPEDVIRWVKALMADPANGIWRQPAATNAAA
jgi:hypothetical protein